VFTFDLQKLPSEIDMLSAKMPTGKKEIQWGKELDKHYWTKEEEEDRLDLRVIF
jgi:hypothetical protein